MNLVFGLRSYGESLGRNFQGFIESKPLCRYVIWPITDKNETKKKLFLICKIALEVMVFIGFSLSCKVTLEVLTTLGRGLSCLSTYGLFRVNIFLINSIYFDIFGTSSEEEKEEERILKELNALDTDALKEKFRAEAHINVDTDYTHELQQALLQESFDRCFFKGLINIFVRYLYLKNRWNESEIKMRSCLHGESSSRREKEQIEKIREKFLLESLKIKIEVAKALVVLKNPFLETIDQMGVYNGILSEPDAIEFLDTKNPFFFSRDQEVRQISFEDVQKETIFILAEKIAQFQR